MALTKVSNSMVDPTPFEVTGEGLDLNIVGAYNFTVGTNNTERLRIDSSGNVGIGLTPTYKLDVKDTSQNIFRLSTVGGSGACRLYLDNNGAGGTGYNQIWSQNNDLVFNANNAEIIRIHSNGRVTINGATAAAHFNSLANDNQYAAKFFGGSTDSQSYGVIIDAGSNANDAPLVVRNKSATPLMTVRGDGHLCINGSAISPHTNTRVIDLYSSDSQFAAYSSGSNFQTWMHNNVYYSSSGSWTFANNGPASSIQATNGQIELRVSNETGTAGNPLSSGWVGALVTNNTGTTAIKFAPVQVSSTDANTLDDYEEGTFTPTVTGSVVAGTPTYSNQSGNYTKIGNCVNFTLSVTISAHTGSGSIKIGGLPFTQAALSSICPVMSNNLTYSAGYGLVGYVYPSAAYMLLYQSYNGVAWSTVAMDTAFAVYISGHYFTA